MLLWDGGNKNIYVSLKYPKELQKRYQRWQQRYFRFYEFPPPQAIGNSGSINPDLGDPCNALREAEQNLIQEFQKWLGEGDVRKIQEQIREKLKQAMREKDQTALDTYRGLISAREKGWESPRH